MKWTYCIWYLHTYLFYNCLSACVKNLSYRYSFCNLFCFQCILWVRIFNTIEIGKTFISTKTTTNTYWSGELTLLLNIGDPLHWHWLQLGWCNLAASPKVVKTGTMPVVALQSNPLGCTLIYTNMQKGRASVVFQNHHLACFELQMPLIQFLLEI